MLMEFHQVMKKRNVIKHFKEPTNVTEVRRFLVLTGYFREFIKNYSLVSRPLTGLLKKENEKNFHWELPQIQAFQKLKEILCDELVLAIYDQNALHEVHTDASSVGLAGVLLQSSDNKSWKPVFYFSRHCNDAVKKLHSYELELLAVVETLDRFRVYLLGKNFRPVTDCSAIAKLKDSTELKPKIARWWLRLSEYDYQLIHRPGKEMMHVDALSRSPYLPANEFNSQDFIMRIQVGDNDWLLTLQLQDKSIVELVAVLKGELQHQQEKQVKKEYALHKNKLYKIINNEHKYVVPKTARWRIIQFCHDNCGHFGTEKTIQRIQRHFWFPKMRKYVKDYINSCIECCYTEAKTGKVEGTLHFIDIEPVPFRQLHIDHIGPFIRSKKGNIYALTISDAFSKYLIVKAVKNTKTGPVINVLNEITSYFGLPSRIITDRGTSFTLKQFKDYCRRNNITHIKTAVRTPRANGQAERANQTILKLLRTVADSKTRDENLREFQWLVNSEKNATTGFSPNEIIFDFKLNEVVTNKLISALQTESTVTEKDLNNIKSKRDQALENIRKERESWKTRFDNKHTKPTQYQQGDLIVIENEMPSTGELRKLQA